MSDQPEPVRLAATVDDGPAGVPVLVLGNSLGTIREMWQPQLATLRKHFRLLQYEHRGHGGSPAPAGPYTVADLGGDVLRLLDELGTGPVAYCGLSLGGMIGMWLAANAPDRINALAVCCTTARMPDQAFWTDRAARVRAGGLGPMAEQIVGRWFTPAFAAADPATPAQFVASLKSSVDPAGYAGCCDAIASVDLPAALPAITAPTLVIAGSEDLATPPWQGAVIARAIPDARLRVIRGASHLANVSQPSEATVALTSHLLAAQGR